MRDAQGNILHFPNNHNRMFCAGHTIDYRGFLIVGGGHVVPGQGTNKMSQFDPVQRTWTQLTSLHLPRWYPGLCSLATGLILITGGTDIVDTITVYHEHHELFNISTGSMEQLSFSPNDPAAKELDYYPFMFPLPRTVIINSVQFPEGSVFYAGFRRETAVLGKVNGQWRWSDVILSNSTNDYASAASYEPGKIMRCGGGKPGKSITEVIDFTRPGPYSWTQTSNMIEGRRNHSLIILPNGHVLALNGNKGDAVQDEWNVSEPVLLAEWWNPDTRTWSPLANMTYPHCYHSWAVLTIYGSVLVGGGEPVPGYPGAEKTAQLFYPPYLSEPHVSRRPSILATSLINDTIMVGNSFEITVENTQNIVKVALVRLGAATHGFDQSQLYVPLTFSTVPEENKLIVNAPPNAFHAPPGYYMLFVLRHSINEQNPSDFQLVPSIGKYVKVVGPIIN